MADRRTLAPARRGRGRRSLTAVLAAAGALGCSDGPTEPALIGDFTWTAPEVIPGMDGVARADWGDFIWNVTGLAVDGRGYVHLLASAGPRDPAWFEFGQVYHTVREPSGAWSAPVRLADSASYSYGALPVVDASGTAHAIWYDRPSSPW